MIIMPVSSIETLAMQEKELEEKLEHKNPVDDRMKVQYLRAKVGAFVIVAGDIAVLGACIFALWLTNATSDVAAAALTSAFAAIASMTSAYFGIRAVSNVVQGANVPQPPAPATPQPPAPVTPQPPAPVTPQPPAPVTP